jgi:small subunit ribosomal protein S17
MSDDTTEATEEPTDAPEAAAPAEEAAAPAPAPKAAAAEAPAEDTGRDNNRKVRDGLVTSNAMDKTAVVAVTDRVRHRRYSKTMQRTTKLYVHDEDNDLNVGDKVRVQETRPLSKNKRWRVLEVLERAR